MPLVLTTGFAEAGGQDQGHIRPAPPDLIGQGRAVHRAGHDHVGKHQVDLLALVQHRQRRPRVGHAQHLVTELPQHGGYGRRDAFVVLDQQHPARLLRLGRRRLLAGQAQGLVGIGEIEGHRRPNPFLADDARRPARGSAEAIDLRQAQARALAHVLGGEERLEHPPLGLGRHAAAGVGDGEFDEVAMQALDHDLRAVAHGDGDGPAGRHGVARVDGDVQHRHLQLGGVHLDRP